MELNGGDDAAQARQSRRDWLRAALCGGGVAATLPMVAGCLPHAAPLAGEIVGANDRVGHWLRDGGAEQRLAGGQPIEWREVDVAIVGGGVAGLAAAYRLERAGCHDFVLLELEESTGGTARSGSRDGFAFPWGAHYLPLPRPDNEPLVRLLEEMGVVVGRAPNGQLIVDEAALCRDPQERLFFEGEWREDLDPWEGADADELRQFDAFRQEIARWIQWRDRLGRRAFSLPSSRSSDDAEVLALDQLTMAQWVAQHGWTSPRLRWFVDYACRDDYGMSIDEVSAWAGLFYFCARQSESSHERGDHAPVDSGVPAHAAFPDDSATDASAAGVPQDGVVADAFGSQPLLTWPEGNGRLVRHLREVAGDRVYTACPVLRIRPGTLQSPTQKSSNAAGDESSGVPSNAPSSSSSGASSASSVASSSASSSASSVASSETETAEVRAEVIAMSTAEERGVLRGWRARRVICAVPQFVARRLIANLPEERAKATESFQYGVWMVANVQMRDRPRDRGFPLAWDNVDYRSDSLGYVVATHQQGIDHGPTVWTWYYAFVNADPRVARRRLYGLSWEDAAALVLSDLERVHPEIRALATRVDVMRWGHAMIRAYPGFRASEARRVAAAPLANVHFAHSELSGLALFEEAFDHACRAADEVLDQLGRQR